MAKELCMLQHSDRGKQARHYFLQLEKAWNTPQQVMARALMAAQRQIEAAEHQFLALQDTVEEQRRKVFFADAVEASHTSILIGDLAKLLKQSGVNIGRNRLFEQLRRDGFLCSCKGGQYNAPTQRSMDMGLLQIRERTINNPDGSVRITRTTKVTGKGQLYFVNRYCGQKDPSSPSAPCPVAQNSSAEDLANQSDGAEDYAAQATDMQGDNPDLYRSMIQDFAALPPNMQGYAAEDFTAQPPAPCRDRGGGAMTVKELSQLCDLRREIAMGETAAA